jgi:hypothetical protein
VRAYPGTLSPCGRGQGEGWFSDRFSRQPQRFASRIIPAIRPASNATSSGHCRRKPPSAGDRPLQRRSPVYSGDDFLIDDGRPTAAYLDRILTSAKQHGLPEEYIRRIEALAR